MKQAALLATAAVTVPVTQAADIGCPWVKSAEGPDFKFFPQARRDAMQHYCTEGGFNDQGKCDDGDDKYKANDAKSFCKKFRVECDANAFEYYRDADGKMKKRNQWSSANQPKVGSTSLFAPDGKPMFSNGGDNGYTDISATTANSDIVEAEYKIIGVDKGMSGNVAPVQGFSLEGNARFGFKFWGADAAAADAGDFMILKDNELYRDEGKNNPVTELKEAKIGGKKYFTKDSWTKNEFSDKSPVISMKKLYDDCAKVCADETYLVDKKAQVIASPKRPFNVLMEGCHHGVELQWGMDGKGGDYSIPYCYMNSNYTFGGMLPADDQVVFTYEVDSKTGVPSNPKVEADGLTKTKDGKLETTKKTIEAKYYGHHFQCPCADGFSRHNPFLTRKWDESDLQGEVNAAYRSKCVNKAEALTEKPTDPPSTGFFKYGLFDLTKGNENFAHSCDDVKARKNLNTLAPAGGAFDEIFAVNGTGSCIPLHFPDPSVGWAYLRVESCVPGVGVGVSIYNHNKEKGKMVTSDGKVKAMEGAELAAMCAAGQPIDNTLPADNSHWHAGDNVFKKIESGDMCTTYGLAFECVAEKPKAAGTATATTTLPPTYIAVVDAEITMLKPKDVTAETFANTLMNDKTFTDAAALAAKPTLCGADADKCTVTVLEVGVKGVAGRRKLSTDSVDLTLQYKVTGLEEKGREAAQNIKKADLEKIVTATKAEIVKDAKLLTTMGVTASDVNTGMVAKAVVVAVNLDPASLSDDSTSDAQSVMKVSVSALAGLAGFLAL